MKLPYSEGSAFLVPLKNAGYVRGVVARLAPRGKVLFGYFFAPRLSSPSEASFEEADPSEAILCLRFGDLGLIRGEWPIVGRVPNWDRNKWPMPNFVRSDPLGKLRPRVVQYSDDDPNKQIREYISDNVDGLQVDALSGYGAVPIKLERALC